MAIQEIRQNESLANQVYQPNEKNTSRLQASQLTDAESKGIQNKITDAQQQLQKLSSNQELTAEEKKQKRQEAQKQIADLNRELRQRQMELRREQMEEQDRRKTEEQKQQKDTPAKEEASVRSGEKTSPDREETEEEKTVTAFPEGSMSAIIATDVTGKQARAQRQVALSLNGTARILQAEIDQDARRGQNTERKEEALEKLEQKASNASSAQIGILANSASNIRQTDKQGKPRQESKNDNQIAVITGAPQNENAQKNAVQRYNIGKRYSSVTFHV